MKKVLTKSEEATKEDETLLAAVHPVANTLLRVIGKKPVRKVPLVGVIVSEAAYIREVYMDKGRFTKNGSGASSSFWNPIVGETGLLNMDGVDHMRLKRVLAPIFSRNSVATILDKQDADIAHYFQKLRDGEKVDIAALTSEMSLKLTCRLIGFPEATLSSWDTQEVIKNLRGVTHGLNPMRKKFTDEQIHSAKTKLVTIETTTKKHYQNETFIEGSVIHLMKKDGYNVDEVTTMVDVLMIAGTETMNSFLPRLTALLIRSETFGMLTHSPELIPKAVEEGLRVTVPTPVAVRVAKEDMDFHGAFIKKGERLILNSFVACGKIGPFKLGREIDRDVKGLWFGAGAHMCIGLAAAIESSNRFVESLVAVAKERGTGYTIVTAIKARKGHTGAYEELNIQ